MAGRVISISAVFPLFVPRWAGILFIETNARPSIYALPEVQPGMMVIDWPRPVSIVCR